MIWNGDIGLELYVASQNYQNADQIADSNNLIAMLDSSGIRAKFDIVPLDELSRQQAFFSIIMDPETEIRLPFLVTAYGCMTGAVLGYSGLQEIRDVLQSISLIK